MSDRLSHAGASAFVADRYGGRATALAPLSAGAWSEAYSCRLDGCEVVIRFGLHLGDYEKDARIGALTPQLLPVPKVLDLGEAPTGYFAVSTRLHGDYLDSLDGRAMRGFLPELMRLLDVIRDLEVSNTTGYGIDWDGDGNGRAASWGGWLLEVVEDRPRIGDWRTALERSPVGAATFEAAAERLQRLTPSLPDTRQLVHQDLFNQNVLVSEGLVTAVLDWGNALYGDALYDVARFLYFWPWFPTWSGIDIESTIKGHWRSIGFVPHHVAERLLAYQLHIGLDHLAYTASMGEFDWLIRTESQVRQLLKRLT